jgi:IS30 family transposase
MFCQKTKSVRLKKKFAKYEIGFLPIDITEVRTEESKLYMFVAIDRVSKYTYVELFARMRIEESILFLNNVLKKFPYKIHTIFTDNGLKFTNKYIKSKIKYPFDETYENNQIKHKFTKLFHPWTNGQVERMNGKIKEATVKKRRVPALFTINRGNSP